MTRQLAALAAVVGLLTTACSVGIAATPTDTEPLVVDVRMKHSRFVPATLSVPAGREVRFVLHNEDFLEHEFIVGDAEVQERHRTGTEPAHDERPTEVDVPGEATVTTTVTFAVPGSLTFACHVTGHYAYGMVGTLTVT
jgi:uncharacterized cupredoxin-like copper-binding protein